MFIQKAYYKVFTGDGKTVGALELGTLHGALSSDPTAFKPLASGGWEVIRDICWTVPSCKLYLNTGMHVGPDRITANGEAL